MGKKKEDKKKKITIIPKSKPKKRGDTLDVGKDKSKKK